MIKKHFLWGLGLSFFVILGSSLQADSDSINAVTGQRLPIRGCTEAFASNQLTSDQIEKIEENFPDIARYRNKIYNAKKLSIRCENVHYLDPSTGKEIVAVSFYTPNPSGMGYTRRTFFKTREEAEVLKQLVAPGL